MYHQYPFRLSGGQRQRVMISIALALEPTVLIADEPTTALDVTTQAQILKLIRDIQRRKGMSVMFITHDFGVVAEIADSVVVMEKGRPPDMGPARRCSGWSFEGCERNSAGHSVQRDEFPDHVECRETGCSVPCDLYG